MSINSNLFDFNSLFNFVCFDSEEDEKAAAEKAAAEKAANDAKKFTQDDVNTILAKEKRKTQDAQKQLMAQLEEAKKTAKTGTDERSELENKIDELQKLTMTAEERGRQKETKLQKQYDDQLSSVTEDKDNWKRRHTELMVSNAILKAASKNKAVEPTQLLKMLRNDIRVAQKIDENSKPIDNFEVRMILLDTDKDNKPIELDLTVDEAVKRMTELPQYGNLFEGGKSGGLGSNNVSGKNKNKIDVAKLAREDPAAYRELRKKNPEAIYSS